MSILSGPVCETGWGFVNVCVRFEALQVTSVLQIESLDKSLEDLLTRVDEFVGMLDMVRIT